jgi:transposase
MITHKAYPSDVTDAEWQFVLPYLCLVREDAAQRVYHLRDLFDGLRWLSRSGSPWRYLPADFPPWHAVYQQARRWMNAGCFESIVYDLRAMIRLAKERKAQPSAVILDSRTLGSTPESGGRAGYNGHKKIKGSKVHIAVDTLGHLLALNVTPANEDDRTQVAVLCEAVQAATGETVEVAFVDQGYTGATVEHDAADHGVHLEVVKLPGAKRGFVLLPRRWVVEGSFAWLARFRRLAKDYERLPEVLAGMNFIAFSFVMLRKATPLLETSA